MTAAPAARREPTVIVARRARPGREREFERWIRRLVERAGHAPGAVDAELQPPGPLHPEEWVVVYRFADHDSLDAWLRSPARLSTLASGADLVEGEVREQVVALAATADQVTAVRSVRVRPDRREEFRALHDEVVAALAASPGFLRCDLFEPVPGVQEDTVSVYAFASRPDLDRWLASDVLRQLLARLDLVTDGGGTLNVVGGFAGWLSVGGTAKVKPWKSAVVVLVALVPITLLYTLVRALLFPAAHVVVAAVLGNVVGVAVLTWFAMPLLTRWLDDWLQR